MGRLYNGSHLSAGRITSRSVTNTHAHKHHTFGVSLGMRLIYLWTHVERAHVHVCQMNFIGLCARLCMATSCHCVYVFVFVYLYIFFAGCDFNIMIPFNMNWQMNLSSMRNDSKWKPHRKLLPSLMCMSMTFYLSRSIDCVIQNSVFIEMLRPLSVFLSLSVYEFLYGDLTIVYQLTHMNSK